MNKLLSFSVFSAALLFLGNASILSAREAAHDPFVLGEIVVTSQKRTEKLQEATVSASVLPESALSDANVSELSDLNNIVPSFQQKGTFNMRVPVAMRGIATNLSQQAIGVTSGVSISIDGVPVPADAMGVNALEDIQRVEVVRGPQSTLGGRAASAGSLNIVTKRPNDTFTGSTGITATTDNQVRLQAYLAGPIADTLKFSVSGVSDDRDYPTKNLYNGKQSNSESRNARIKLLFEPTPDLSFMLTGHAASLNNTGCNWTYQVLPPGIPLFPMIPPGIPQSEALEGVRAYWGNTEYNSPVDMRAEMDSRDTSLAIDYNLANHTLSSITAYQKENRLNIQDVTATAVYFLDVLTHGNLPHWGNDQKVETELTSFSQEFKVVSPAEDPVNFVAGLFFSDVTVDAYWVRDFAGSAAVDFDRKSETRNFAAYGRVTWGWWDNTNLITGLRYNRDELHYTAVQGKNLPYVDYYSPPKAENTSSAWVGDITLQHDADNDLMFYATYARGYKPKAYNTAGTLKSDDPLPNPVEQEKIDHFELGAKTVFKAGRLVANASVFDTIYKNYQVQVWTSEPTGEQGIPTPILKMQSAGEAETRGIELDLTAAPVYGTQLNLNLAYIHAKFNSFKNAPAYPTQTEAEGASPAPNSVPPKYLQDLSGSPMPDAPRFKATVGVEQRIPQDRLPFDILLRGNYAYRSKACMLANQNPKAIQDAFGILDLSVKAVSLSGKYSLTLFVNNVFDKFYLINAGDFWSGLWGPDSNVIVGDPARDASRYAGITITAKF